MSRISPRTRLVIGIRRRRRHELDGHVAVENRSVREIDHAHAAAAALANDLVAIREASSDHRRLLVA
jgi:hypothetical protein